MTDSNPNQLAQQVLPGAPSDTQQKIGTAQDLGRSLSSGAQEDSRDTEEPNGLATHGTVGREYKIGPNHGSKPD